MIKLKNLLSECNFSLIDFESKNLTHEFENILKRNKTKHCVLVSDPTCINKKLIKYDNIEDKKILTGNYYGDRFEIKSTDNNFDKRFVNVDGKYQYFYY